MGRNVSIICDHCSKSIMPKETYYYGFVQKRIRNSSETSKAVPSIYLCEKCYKEIYNKGEKE